MPDELMIKMYESAREKVAELIRQETEVKEQIEHWIPVVEKLAQLTGEELPEDIKKMIKQLNDAKQPDAVEDMGLTEAIRWVFKQPQAQLPMTPTQVRDELARIGFDLDKYAAVMPPIHNTLKRMKENGEIVGMVNLLRGGKTYKAK
jgi:hypothetical protein